MKTKLFAFVLCALLTIPAWAVEQVKQSSTAYPLTFMLVDSSDHVSAKTGVTPTVTLSKAGGSFASPSGSVTEVANGLYKIAGNATDTGTLGALWLHASGTGCDPTDVKFEVVAVDLQSATAFITGVNSVAPPTNWNLMGIDSSGRVDIGKILGTASSGAVGTVAVDYAQVLPTTPTANTTGEALYLADAARGRRGTAQAGASTTITLDSGASADSTSYIGDCIYLLGGTGGGVPGTGQRRTVIGYNGSTKVATVDRAWSTTPDATTTFVTLPEPLANQGAFAPGVGRTFYVATTGSDSLTGSYDAPYLTPQAALAVCRPYDTVRVRAGTYTTSGAGITLPAYVHLVGSGPALSIISDTVSGAVITMSEGSTIEGIKIVNAAGQGVLPGSYSEITNCWITVTGDNAVLVDSKKHVRATRSRFISTCEPVAVSTNSSLELFHCNLEVSGTVTATIYPTTIIGLHNEESQVNMYGGTISISASTSGAAANARMVGATVESGALSSGNVGINIFDGVTIRVANLTAGNTGGVYGIGSTDVGQGGVYAVLANCKVATSNANGSAAKSDIGDSGAGSNIVLANVTADRTTFLGATGITDNDATIGIVNSSTYGNSAIKTSAASAATSAASAATSSASAATSSATAATQATAANTIVGSGTYGNAAINTKLGTPLVSISADIATSFANTVDNTKIVQARVTKLGTRADGVTVAFPDIRPRAGETLPWWVDTTQFAGGDWVETVSNVASSDASAVAITMNGESAKAGVNREDAVIWLTPVWTSGHDSADITFDLTPHGGQTIKVLMHASKPTQ